MKEKTGNCLLKIVNWQFAPQVNTKQGAELQYCLVVIQIVLYDRKITLFRLGQCRRKSSYHYQSQVFLLPLDLCGRAKKLFLWAENYLLCDHFFIIIFPHARAVV